MSWLLKQVYQWSIQHLTQEGFREKLMHSEEQNLSMNFLLRPESAVDSKILLLHFIHQVTSVEQFVCCVFVSFYMDSHVVCKISITYVYGCILEVPQLLKRLMYSN